MIDAVFLWMLTWPQFWLQFVAWGSIIFILLLGLLINKRSDS